MGRWWRNLGRGEQVTVIGIAVTLTVGLVGALPAYFVFFADTHATPSTANTSAPTTNSPLAPTTSAAVTTSSTMAEASSTIEGNSSSDCLTPSISLQPDEGKVGTRITVRGCGFPAHTVLTSVVGQVFGYPDLPAVRTDAQGRFRVAAPLKVSSYSIDYNQPLTIAYQVDSDHSVIGSESFLLRK